jgi:hypothetical protein
VANKQRGEVDLSHDGKTYTLKFSINALCELEDAMGLRFDEIFSALGERSMSMNELRSMLWGALRDNHPDIEKKVVGEIIEGMGVVKAISLVHEVITSAFPQGDKSPKKK